MKKIQIFITHLVSKDIIETNDILTEEVTFLEKITKEPHKTTIVYYSPDNSMDNVYDMIPNGVDIVKNDRKGIPYTMPSMRNKVLDLADDYFVLLHDDIRVSVGWLTSLTSDLKKAESIYKDRCVMAPRFVPYHYIPGTIQPRYPEFWKEIYESKLDFLSIEDMKEWCRKWNFKFEDNMLYSLPPGHITDDGHALMMFISSKKFFDDVGGNDERYIYRRHDDDDWGITALMKDKKNLKSQTSLIGHMTHLTLGHPNFKNSFFDSENKSNIDIFVEKWGRPIFNDMTSGNIWTELHRKQLEKEKINKIYEESLNSSEKNMRMKHTNSEKSWRWHLTFIGQYMQHNYYEYYILDDIIENNPQIKSIIEIGTGYGSLTTVLGLHGVKKGIPVFTVDINPDLSRSIHDIFKSLGVQFYSGDVFDNTMIDKINSVIKGQPTYIICDGGNKIKEFNFWSPKIPVGSIISAHDWGVEISMNDIKATVDKYLEPYRPERWIEMNIQFATFKKMKQ